MTLMFKGRAQKIHFVGIGGIGMSGIAEVLLNLGYEVSGSDLRGSETTQRLASLGGRILVGHAAEHLRDADVVVISSAVKPENPEVIAARHRGIPVIPRAEMLAELMRMKYGVAVAGSHGKTTTTSMIAAILDRAALDPTVVIGGKVNSLGTNARLGQGDYLVAEADESDGSFIRLSPTVAVVTNIDPEHLDHYGSMERLRETFLDFVNKIPFYGLSILCLDCENIQSLLPRVEKRHVTYGKAPQADYSLRDVQTEGFSTSFLPIRRGEVLDRVMLRMVGRHNVLNALATIAVADELEIPFATAREALCEFGGVQRRFTVKGEAAGIMVVDDYAHHPAEIKATLLGAREAFSRRVVAVFQPHRYTRTRLLYDQFATAFYDADVVLVTDIYPAGEEPIPDLSVEDLVASMRGYGHRDATFCPTLAALSQTLNGRVERGDVVVTLGAGDVWKVGRDLLEELGKRQSSSTKK
jgi:UDP-N-acetylmuramate--alanine ligase